MDIDEAIQQTRWESQRQRSVVDVLYTGRCLESLGARGLRAYGLTPQQFNVLRILRGQKGQPASVKLLAERMLDPSSNASRLVDKLLEKGLVERATCPGDRRSVDIRLTASGTALLARLDEPARGWLPRPELFPEADARQLCELLDRLRDALPGAAPHHPPRTGEKGEPA
jgi:DNA-binding MarR family transcriptional regulator